MITYNVNVTSLIKQYSEIRTISNCIISYKHHISIYAYEDDDELIQNIVAYALSKGHPETSRSFVLQANAATCKRYYKSGK